MKTKINERTTVLALMTVLVLASGGCGGKDIVTPGPDVPGTGEQQGNGSITVEIDGVQEVWNDFVLVTALGEMIVVSISEFGEGADRHVTLLFTNHVGNHPFKNGSDLEIEYNNRNFKAREDQGSVTLTVSDGSKFVGALSGTLRAGDGESLNVVGDFSLPAR